VDDASQRLLQPRMVPLLPSPSEVRSVQFRSSGRRVQSDPSLWSFAATGSLDRERTSRTVEEAEERQSMGVQRTTVEVPRAVGRAIVSSLLWAVPDWRAWWSVSTFAVNLFEPAAGARASTWRRACHVVWWRFVAAGWRL
jgi:hypothetical protein